MNKFLERNFCAYKIHLNLCFLILGVGGVMLPSYFTIVPRTFGIPKASEGFKK